MEKELNSFRLGYLELYLLKYINYLPQVGMSPFAALVAGEIERPNKLRAGKSLVSSKLNYLCEQGFLKVKLGQSPNPRAKKGVKLFSLTKKGKKLVENIEKEQERISQMLSSFDNISSP